VIDSIGCALGAWHEEPCVIARTVASDFSAKNGATIIGTAHKGATRLGRLCDRLLHPVFRLQRHLSLERAGPSKRQPRRGFCGSPKVSGPLARKQSPPRPLPMKCNAVCAMRPAFGRGAGIHPTYGSFSTALAAAKLMKTRRGEDAPGDQYCRCPLCGVFGRRGWVSYRTGRAWLCQCRAPRSLRGAAPRAGAMTGPAPIFEGQMGFEKELGVSLGDVGEVFDKAKQRCRRRTGPP